MSRDEKPPPPTSYATKSGEHVLDIGANAMTERCVPVVQTLPTMADYVRAVMRSWSVLFGGVPLEQSIAVLFGQYVIETGMRACFGWNIGNVKHVKGDGFNYHMLRGVWEGVSKVTADNLIASGHAVRDDNANHAKSVGPTKVSVIFQPPHPATWFRAFDSLDHAMEHHLQLLSKRFAGAWPAVLAGDFAGFAHALHSQRYFTADPSVYAAGMRGPFERLVASSTYEEMIATRGVAPEAGAVEVPEGSGVLHDWLDEELQKLASIAHQGASSQIMADMVDAAKRRIVDDS